MRIAILIGVETYLNDLGNLPACKNDVKLMERVLRATDDFAHILCISSNCTGSNIKAKMSTFVSELKGNTIDEIFYYFTGHGDFYDEQFHYLLSDFEISKRNQTSLENTVVDNWLRHLQAKLTIKVIDACHSGISYIKNEYSMEEYLNKSREGFKDCYFMFSSSQDQTSYQDSDLSYFTRSFLMSLSRKELQEVHYKDITDYISDDFIRFPGQTPIFVSQGPLTEVFCSRNPEIMSVIEPIINNVESENNDHHELLPNEPMSLEKIIEADAKHTCNAEETEFVLSNIKSHLSNHEYPLDIASVYKLEYKFESHEEYEKLLKEEVIGNWLDKNGKEYFAEPAVEDIPYEVDVPDWSTFGMMRGGYRTKTKYRKTIIGFKNTANLSYNLIRINAEPKFPNIPPFNCTLVIIVSKKSMILFYYYTLYREINWSKRKLVPDIKWHYYEEKLKNENKILASIINVQQSFGNHILRVLQERFKS